MAGLLVFALLFSTDTRSPAKWVRTAAGIAAFAAVTLGWFAIRLRNGSLLTIRIGALTFSLGTVGLAVWRGLLGQSAVEIGLLAFVPALLSATSWWALSLASRLHAGCAECFARPHITRRLSLPLDVRALRAAWPAFIGGIYILMMAVGALALGPLLRQGAISVSLSVFLPARDDIFGGSGRCLRCARRRFVGQTAGRPSCYCDPSPTTILR